MPAVLAQGGEEMKKLTLLIALFTVMTVSAHAADPAVMNRSKSMQKVQTMKKQLKPAVATKIKPGMRIVKPGDTEEGTPEDNNEPETTEPEEPAGTYTLALSELRFGADPQSCALTWQADVTNSGSVASPASLKVEPVKTYDLENNEPYAMTVLALPSVAPGQSQMVEGSLSAMYATLKDLIVNVKDGNTVLDSKSATIPEEGDYSVSLGAAQEENGHFIVSITNDGAAPVASLLVVFQGITSAEPIATFRIVENTKNCVAGGETVQVQIPATDQEHVGYRVMVNKTGEGAYLVMKDYIL